MNTSNQNRVIILAITEGGLTVTEAATRFNMSPRWIYTLLSRYKTGGLTAVDPVSRRPHTNPHATQPDMITAIVALRDELTRKGLDAGAQSIWDRLPPQSRPSVATIWRILRRHDKITAQPQKWLRAAGPARTLDELNTQLAQFALIYNTERPHRAINRHTPHQAYTALPKAHPTLEHNNLIWRTRYDIVGTTGKITVRYAGKLRHLAIGRKHAGSPVILLIHGPDTIIINRATGHIIAEHTINPDKNYQPKKPTGGSPHEP